MTKLVYGVFSHTFIYVFETVAKSVPDAAGPAVDPAAFDPVGADAGALLEAGAGADALDMARCIQVSWNEFKTKRWK